MSEITLTAGITDYASMSPEEYQEVSFSINEKSMVISILDDNQKVLIQTEIELKDAKILAKLINI
jgi:nitrogen regulatory protein PII-like uncharacterized protein